MIPCPYCAESIQDAAIVCRFCQATRLDGVWSPPKPGPLASSTDARPPGQTTFQLTALSLAAAAAYELFRMTAPVPLAGELRGGAAAIAWHVLFASVWAVMAYTFARRPAWGLRAIAVATVVYAADTLAFVLDDVARQAMLAEAVGGAEVLDLIDPTLPDQAAVAMRLGMLACWVVLAGYTWVLRDTFGTPNA